MPAEVFKALQSRVGTPNIAQLNCELRGTHLPYSKMSSRYFAEQKTILSLRELLPDFFLTEHYFPATLLS
jgi:hypothetical protein